MAEGSVVHEDVGPTNYDIAVNHLAGGQAVFWSADDEHGVANELTSVVLDPNVHIQESKAATCDSRPGRRPRGAALPDYVEEYQRRAGADDGGDRPDDR